jgi:aspartyl-tRNA(Asn)/glutamyl-tRNA(Gln) amidotransferase subunit C
MELDIDYIANLARLQLMAEEKKVFGSQLKSILSYMEKLSRLETKEVLPTFQTISLEDEVREDRVDRKRGFESEGALGNAPAKKGKFFSVPKIFDN